MHRRRKAISIASRSTERSSAVLKNDTEQAAYFAFDFLPDGFRRFFSSAVSLSSEAARGRCVRSFDQGLLNSLDSAETRDFASTFRCAIGFGKLSVTVLPRTL